jgi:predicted transcriptional regulator
MRSEDEHKALTEPDGFKQLQVLLEVESSPQITQRQLAERVGIALGLTNTLLRSLTKKGYIRAQKASWKRWIYGLTPDGFSYKLRLTVAYIRRFMDHYQKVRHTLREQLQPLALHEESKVAIFGTGEFAELVYLGLMELHLEEIDVFTSDPAPDQQFLGKPVKDINDFKSDQYDRLLVAKLNGSSDVLDRLLNETDRTRKVVRFFEDAVTAEEM